MVSGVYSTVFIASGLVYFWGVKAMKRSGKKSPMTAPFAAKSSAQQ
jgi:preprotein translocase subunit SecF